MSLGLLCLFIALPLLEIVVLIQVGGMIGAASTILLLIVSGVVGITILNHQGFRALNRVMADLQRGAPPVASMADGMLLMLAGGLFIFPGFISDAIGLALLLPDVRRMVLRAWLRWLKTSGSVTMSTSEIRVETAQAEEAVKRPRPTDQAPRDGDPGGGKVIEGEFERIDEKTIDPNRRPKPDPLR